MWSAFLTGAAKQATTLIEDRDKEIRDNMNIRLNEMYKRAEIAKKEAEERRDELTGIANELVGAGFDEQETAYLLQNPEQAKKIIDYADKTGGITATKKQQLFSKNKEHLSAMQGESARDYIKRVTTLGTGERESLMAPGEMEGAFGLPSRAAQRGMSEFLAKSGRTEQDLLATELPGREIKPLGLDMSVFAEPESTTDIKARLRDVIARSEKTDEGIPNESDQKEFDTLTKQLEASVIIDDMFEAEEDDKPRTASEIRAIFRGRLSTTLDPYVLSGVAQVISTGDIVPITGDPADIAKFRATRNNVIKNIAANRGLYDPRTMEVTGGRAAEDALSDYATIENGKIVNWDVEAPDIQSIRNAPKEGDESTDTNNKKIVFRDGRWVYP